MQQSAHAERTLPLSVRNTGFLLDRLGRDCHPLQFLRELTQNAIEAILRTPEKKGDILWDVEWNNFDLTNTYKLCVIDNGEGMTGEEMVRYINQLSSSVAEQSIEGNYGVGAKIAAATRNHCGLVYLSWKNGKGSMIHLWRDPVSQQYGLKQLERPDGTFGHHADVEDSLKPDLIGEHGTMIVLLGNREDEDTMKAPEGVASPSRWTSKYLNSRYFQFPQGVTVKAREGWDNPRTDVDRNVLRSVIGQREYVTQHSVSSGSVRLTGAVAHWWILKDEPALGNNSGFIESAGHIAALYENELYELATARAGRARLQQFGILFGHNRVVLYLQPTGNGTSKLISNTARTQLLQNGEPLPWSEWAAEFRDNMPKDIQALMEEASAASQGTDHTKSIRDRLKQIMDLYKVSRYRPTPAGEILIDEETARGGQSRSTGSSRGSGGGRSGGRGGDAGSLYTLFLKADGIPGEAVRRDIFPEVRWVSAKKGTRTPGDIEDRAARYLRDQNVLLINEDFRVFQDMIKYWLQHEVIKQWLPRSRDQSGVQPIISATVTNWFEQALVETVIGVLALKDAKEWSIDDIDRALSEEALTAAVVQRYHVVNSIKRELGTKIGKLQTA